MPNQIQILTQISITNNYSKTLNQLHDLNTPAFQKALKKHHINTPFNMIYQYRNHPKLALIMANINQFDQPYLKIIPHQDNLKIEAIQPTDLKAIINTMYKIINNEVSNETILKTTP